MVFGSRVWCVCVYKKAQQLVSPRGKLVPPRELSDSVVGNFSYNAKPPLSENNCFEIVFFFLQWLIVLFSRIIVKGGGEILSNCDLVTVGLKRFYIDF